MIVRFMMTSIVLLVSLHASSQPSSSLQFDEVFETVLKTGRLDPQHVIKALDRLRVTATRPQDSIPILCVQALNIGLHNRRQVEAVQLIRNAQTLANDLGVQRYDHQMLYLKGYLFKPLNEDSSHRYLTEALRVAKVAGDSVIISESLTILSFLEMERGNFLKAWRNLDQSQRFFSKTDYRRIANNRTNQSHALSAIGLFERSIAVADEGIAVVKHHPYPGSRNDLMSLYGNVINAYLDTDRPERAMHYAQEASAMFPNLDSLNAFNSYFMISLGNTYLALDSAARALQVFQRSTLDKRYQTALFQKKYGIFKANQRLGDLRASRLAAQEIVRNIPAIRGLKNKIDIYQIAEEAFSFLGMRDSAYQYHQIYFDNYKQLYNQEQSSAILESEFTAELARERETAKLHALMLQSEIKLSDQRVLFLVIILTLIIFLVVLLVVRYRSLRKFSLLLEQKVQERTRELTDRNHQLSEYAFINAHKVRAPLARVLGLSDLIAREKDVSEVIRLSQLVKRESESLDTIIRSINAAIQEDRVVSRDDLQ